MPAELIYPSLGLTLGLGRQSVVGTARTTNLYKILGTTINPKITSNVSSLGLEVGSGNISESRIIKEAFMPEVDISGHLRVGAGLNLLCASGYMTLSTGVAAGTPVNTTLSAAVVARHSNTATVASAVGLSAGQWVQIGALATPVTPVVTDVSEVHQILSIAANVLTFTGKLLYAYPSGAAVALMDNAKAVTHYFLHVGPDNSAAGAADLYTIFMKVSNGTNTVSLLFVDCSSSSFNLGFSVGQIATFQSALKALSVDRTAATIAGVTTIADPSSIFVNNTRGSFSLLGNTLDAPRQISINLAAELYDDMVLTQYFKQSNIHISHTINLTSGGKFVKNFFDLINFVNAAGNVATDAIPESLFQLTAQSAKVVGATAVNYSFGMNAPAVQFANYNPTFNTNQPVDASIEMGKVVRNQTTDVEEWYFTAVNNCTTDVYSAT